uniref:OTU domain-containing protein n=1 Tax=Amphimedon queenslandica TaxID=400682 RepID=A0A1X7UVP1_AMPQE
SNPCINEINSIRSKFWNDLPQIKKSKGKKRKIQVTGIIDDGEPCNLKTKFTVKDDDSCNSLIVSIDLSSIKCKPKDDKTKQLIQKKMIMSSLLMKSLPIQIMLGDKGITLITLLMKKKGGVILNLKFVTAARILAGSPTTPLSDERVPNSTLDVPIDGNCLFYAHSYLITGSIS